VASLVADLDHWGVKQLFWRDESGLRLTSHVSTTPGTIHDAHDLEERRGVSFPAICEKQGKLPGTRDDLRDEGGCRILGTWSKVDPEQKPAAHRQSRMHPFHLFGTELSMGFIQVHALHLHVLHALPMVHLGSLGRHALKAVDRLERHGTDVSSDPSQTPHC
jgi:hypothetical protein